MSGSTTLDTAFFLQWLVLAILFFGGLAAVLAIVNAVLRRLVSIQILRTDRELVGMRAEVVRTIRPNKNGQIRCRTDSAEPLLAEASSDRLIDKGTMVLITAIRKDRCLVLPVEPAIQVSRPT